MEAKQTKEIMDGNEKDFYHRDVITHSLGSFWTCPSHVPEVWWNQTSQTLDDWYCFIQDSSNDTTF